MLQPTVKQFTSEVNRPSLPSLFHHGVEQFLALNEMKIREHLKAHSQYTESSVH